MKNERGKPMAWLDNLDERQQQEVRFARARLGLEWKEHGLLFPSEVGTPIIPRNLNRHYYQTQENAGISPRYTLHALRHTAGTAFDGVKASKAKQRAIMGHSPGDVSEGYIHPEIAELYSVLVEAEARQMGWAA
jgi:integrase